MKGPSVAVALLLAALGAGWLVLANDKTPNDRARVSVASPTATPAREAPRFANPQAPASIAPAAPAVTPTAVTIPLPNDRPARVLQVAEGAPTVAAHLAQADRPQDVLLLGGAMASDPEMCAAIEREATRWRQSNDPALRARAVLVLSAIGKLDARGWEQAVASEADATARAQLVEATPRDPARGGRLLGLAERDGSAEVRAAAVTALPEKLDASEVERLARVLERDEDPRVRVLAATWFRATKRTDSCAVRGLVASATRAEQDLAVRRASVHALLTLEETTPGTLRSAGVSAEQLHDVLEKNGNDRG